MYCNSLTSRQCLLKIGTGVRTAYLWLQWIPYLSYVGKDVIKVPLTTPNGNMVK